MRARKRGRWFAGRFSGNQAAELGALMKNGVGYIAFGHLVILFDLPRRYRVANPEPYEDSNFPWSKLEPAPEPNKNWRADRSAATAAKATDLD